MTHSTTSTTSHSHFHSNKNIRVWIILPYLLFGNIHQFLALFRCEKKAFPQRFNSSLYKSTFTKNKNNENKMLLCALSILNFLQSSDGFFAQKSWIVNILKSFCIILIQKNDTFTKRGLYLATKEFSLCRLSKSKVTKIGMAGSI